MEKYSVDKKKETYQQGNGFNSYILFIIVIVVFGFIIAKDIALPKAITLPIAVVGLGVLFYGSFTNSHFSLMILAAYLPFSKILIGRFGAEMVGLNLTNILMIIVILGWIFNAVSKGQKVFDKSSLNLIVILFGLWGLFSLIRARFLYGEYYDLNYFIILFKRWITPIFLYFIGLNLVKDKEAFKKVVFVMMLATFIVALMAIRDYITVGDRGNLDDSRIGGVFEQPNMLGAYFVYNMFFFLGFFFYYWRSFKYWLLLIPFLSCFRGIMVTFSRGAYLAFGFGSLMITFFRSKFLFFIFLFLLIFTVINPIFIPEGMKYRLASTFGGEKVFSTDTEDITDASAGKRIILWRGAIEMIKDQPWFGFGYGMFPHIIGFYVPRIPEADAHNTYLIIAAEMGIPALIIFLVILFMLLKDSRWLLRHSEDRYFKAFALGMIGGIFGLIVANMFGSRLNSEEISSYFWLLAGLLMRAVIMRKREQIT